MTMSMMSMQPKKKPTRQPGRHGFRRSKGGTAVITSMDVAKKIQGVQELSLQPNHAEAATDLVIQRLNAFKKVLMVHIMGAYKHFETNAKSGTTTATNSMMQQLQQQQQLQHQKSMWDSLQAVQAILSKTMTTTPSSGSMNAVVFIVQSRTLARELQDQFEVLSDCLDDLVTALPLNDAQQRPLARIPLNEYYTVCDNQVLQFKALDNELQVKQDEQLASFLVKNNTKDDSTEGVYADALRILTNELQVFTVDMQSNPKLSVDPKARGVALQRQDYLKTVVERLQLKVNAIKGIATATMVVEVAPAATIQYPEWALDPLTRHVMKEPVIIRCKSKHTVDQSSFKDWVAKGNRACPVCQGSLKGKSTKPNADMAEAIWAFQTTTGGATPTLTTNNTRSLSPVRRGNFSKPKTAVPSTASTGNSAMMSIQEDSEHSESSDLETFSSHSHSSKSSHAGGGSSEIFISDKSRISPKRFNDGFQAQRRSSAHSIGSNASSADHSFCGSVLTDPGGRSEIIVSSGSPSTPTTLQRRRQKKAQKPSGMKRLFRIASGESAPDGFFSRRSSTSNSSK